MVKKTVSAAFAVSALLIGGIVTAAPAQAVPQDCPRGNYCVWTAPNHSGDMRKYSTSQDLLDAPIYTNDRSSYNRMSQYAMVLYYKPGQKGRYACAPAQAIWYGHNPEKQLVSLGKARSC